MNNNVSNNIIVCSHNKSGTNLVQKLVKHISGTSGKAQSLNSLKEEILDLAGIKTSTSEIQLSGISASRNHKLCVHINHLENGCVIHQDRLELDEKLLYRILSYKRINITSHINPAAVYNSPPADRIKYKIFVSRDFRDVFNSKTKFVNHFAKTKTVMEILQSYEAFKQFNYLNIMHFHSYLNSWSSYVESYLEHKDDMFLLKYEDLINHPVLTMRKLADYLNAEVNDEYLESLVTQYFNKELQTSLMSKLKYFRNFSKSSKRKGEWRNYFNSYMIEQTKQKAGDLLIKLGYEKDNSWGKAEIISDQQEQFRIRLDRSCVNYCSNFKFGHYQAEAYLESLDNILLNNNVVIYGAGSYSINLIKRLKNKKSIAFAVDNDTDKHGSKIENVSVVCPESAVTKFLEYDLILVAVHPRNRSGIFDQMKKMGVPMYKIKSVYNKSFDQLTHVSK